MSINQRRITRSMLAKLVEADCKNKGSFKIEGLRATVRQRLPEASYIFLDRLRAECDKMVELRKQHRTSDVAISQKEITRLHKLIKGKFL